VTVIGSTYTASHGAAGNMTCRAPTSSSTCAGTQTGAQLTYDNEGRLLHWQNAPTSPTSTADFAYDGEGNRVGQQSSNGGPATITYYLLGGLEAVGNGGTLTKCYWAIGRWMGDRRERGRSRGGAGGQGRHACRRGACLCRCNERVRGPATTMGHQP
jgi:YD repeat-containing protein